MRPKLWRTRLGQGIVLLITGLAAPLAAQGPPVIEFENGPEVRDLSLIFIDSPPPPPEIKVHDIIMIEVDEKAEVIVNSRFNRQRNGAYTAALRQFIRFGQNGNLENAATNAPTIEATLQNRLQALGTATDLEGITYKIGATVVDILPNGTLVLEARKTIRSNQDFFEYRLTGTVAASAVTANRTVRTERFANLDIVRSQKGKIFDSTKVNWGTRILDIITPF
jgi:flagellar L-ring protein precursor FlgH